jgi:DNA-directed RNA polymerase subunit RPC12/RpoP
MDAHYKCEDCGNEFPRTSFTPDVEDDLLACPACGGLDIQLVETPAEHGEMHDAA